jgi:hypothetical protein
VHASSAKPLGPQALDRTAVAIGPASLAGATIMPTVIPGARRFERLSITTTLGHRCADGIVQRGLTVDGAKRRFHVRHGQRIRLHPSIVHRNRDELDARARGHRLEHRICQRVGSQTLSGPQNGGQDCAKTLLAVTGE